MMQSANSLHNSKVLPVGLDLVLMLGLKLSVSACVSQSEIEHCSNKVMDTCEASYVNYNRLYSDFIVGVSE